jgi:nicotinate-nucleotide adenylyltransferase
VASRRGPQCESGRLSLSLRGRVGLFGGTFNPLHNAHVRVARSAFEQLGLSSVLFIPNGIPPHKGPLQGIGPEDRYRMVCAAIRGCKEFAVSRIEIDREGPSYTIDTIRALEDDYGQGICFIVGADRLLDITTWKEPEALLRSVPFVIAPRKGVSVSAFDSSPFDAAQVHFLDMEEVDLSSSWVREKIVRGEDIGKWVPPDVATYIAQNGLYRNRELSGIRSA